MTTWAWKIRVAFEFYSVEDPDLQLSLGSVQPQLTALPNDGTAAVFERPWNSAATLGLTLLDKSCTNPNSYGG